MKNNDHLQSRMGEKRHYFGIRRLKVGVASVVIASGFLLGNAQLVRADEASTATSPATEAVSDTNAAAQPKSADEGKTGEADSSGAGASEQAAPTGVVQIKLQLVQVQKQLVKKLGIQVKKTSKNQLVSRKLRRKTLSKKAISAFISKPCRHKI